MFGAGVARAQDVFACAGATVFTSVYSWSRGQDANWDLQNYHDYVAFALLHWRYPLDVAPASFQSFFNPLIYVLPYLLRRHLDPQAAAILLGAAQSVTFWPAWVLSGRLIPPGPDRLALRLLALAAAMGGAITLSEMGTSFADLALAAPVLWALLLLLRADGGGVRVFALAGLLAGAAAGLKLTEVMYGVGLAAVALTLPGSARHSGREAARAVSRASHLAALAAGGATGFLLLDGWWAAYLWHAFGNPVFPLLNNVFRSPDAEFGAFAELAFLPAGMFDALSWPWDWATGRHPGVEVPLRDARALLAFGAIVLAACRWRALRQGRDFARCVLFLAVSAAVWARLSGVLRYALALEILCGLLIVAACAGLPRRLALPAAATLAVVLAAWTSPAEFWHRPWRDAYAGPGPAAFTQPVAVLMLDSAQGYLVPWFPPGSRFYKAEPMLEPPDGALRKRLLAGLHAPPPGGAWVIAHDQPMAEASRHAIGAAGFGIGAGCRRLRSLWWIDTVACPLVAGFSDGLAPLNADIGFTAAGDGWAYEAEGWLPAEAEGTWAAGPSSTLVFRHPGTDGALRLRVHAVPTRALHAPRVQADVDGEPAGAVQRAGDGWTNWCLALPMSLGGPMRLRFTTSNIRSPSALGLSRRRPAPQV